MPPKEEFPNIEEIRSLALINLPQAYVLKDVRISDGTDEFGGISGEFEIVIDYEDTSDDEGSFAHIERHQNWSHALIQDIRSEWPSESIGVRFSGKQKR